ncbi:MAG: hypothetical protein JNJ73_18790 [Hyphomonadaceae bacterium]|nr:hypothetical protein [Hyphomonadaceae bacterium]
MRSLLVVAALAVAGISAPAFAQPRDGGVRDAGTGAGAEAMMAQFEASQAQAQAGAQRPGDEAMTCEQLQAEFMIVMNDPQFRQNVADMGVWAQSQQQRAQAARGQAMAGMGASMAMGLASSFIPGLGYAQGAMMQAQVAGMQRQAQQAAQEREVVVGNVQTMMPTAYRGERLYNLAQAKQCAFLQGGDAPAPYGAPGAQAAPMPQR